MAHGRENRLVSLHTELLLDEELGIGNSVLGISKRNGGDHHQPQFTFRSFILRQLLKILNFVLCADVFTVDPFRDN